MTENDFEIKINVPMIKELVSDKIYRSDASAFREQYVNALSHGCISYHEQHGYTDDINVHVEFDYGLRKVTITDNGMGMDKTIFSDNFMSFGFSTVDKKTNNTRSGMFGLGAISFFRIATACIVESWDRKTDERFCFMTRNTDESEFVANRTLEGPGTKTEIFLKEHVNIRTLIDMVNKIAVNYPVVTILEINNSEGEQTISSYNNTDQDSYTKFDATMRFKDHVSKQTSEKFVEIVNDEEMELYISTHGRNVNHSYLCRVPIDVEYNTGFSTYLNIKKEKIAGEDSKGNAKLQEVPKPDRDEVNEIASRYFQAKIEKLCDDFIKDIDIKTFEEYETSDKRWVLDGYSVDDKLNPLTHEFIQKMREPVKYRNALGIQKRHESLLTIFAQTNNVFYHPTLHKGTFDAINMHYKKIAYAEYCANETVEEKVKFEQFKGPWEAPVLINDTHGMPIRDAKQFKKDNNIQSIKTITVGNRGSVTGILVRDGEWNNTKLTTNDPVILKHMYPGGIYYLSDSLANYHNIHATPTRSPEAGTYYLSLLSRNRVGLVAAKKGAKLFPSYSTFIAKIRDASIAGRMIIKRDNNKIEERHTEYEQQLYGMEHVEDVKDDRGSVTYSYLNFSKCTDREVIEYLNKWYSIRVLPDTMLKISIIDDVPGMTLFMPKELIHGASLMIPSRPEKSQFMFLEMLQHMPKWTKIKKDTMSFITSKFRWMYYKYSHTHWQCRQDITSYLIKLYESKEIPSQTEYNEGIETILDEYEESYYYYNYSYRKMFPHLFLRQKAQELGYTNDQIMERNDSNGTKQLFVHKDEIAETGNNIHQVPIEIEGKLYSMASVNQQGGWQAMINDNGEPILVNHNLGHPNIVKVDGKLKYEQEISEWD